MRPIPAGTFWWQVRLTGPMNTDKLASILFGLETTGLLEEAGATTAYFDGDRFASETELVASLTKCLEGPLKIEVSRQPAEDWETEWKKNFKPTRVSRRLVVRPSWTAYRKRKNDVVIVIDPKMSFGTGTHESTRLALRLVEKTMTRGARVLDVGTGTGILAIASVKLGAGRVFACDIDDYSIANARENLRRNRCTHKTRLRLGSLKDLPSSWPKTYTTILANIQRTVILDLLSDLCTKLTPNGLLIAAGLLAEEAAVMRQAFTFCQLDELVCLTEGEWMAFALRRRS